MLRFLFFFFPIFIYSQSIKILDLNTKEPINYVVVELYSGENVSYDYSNVDGIFTVPTNKTISKIKFSCLGYESKELLFNEIKGKIYLTPKITLLNEVVVSNVTKILGNLSDNVKLTYGTGLHFENCFFIDNTLGKESLIKNFQFYMSKLSNKLTYVMRFRLYKKDLNSIYPGELIDIQNNFFEINKKHTGLFKIDFTDFSFLLPKEGAFISIEIVEVKNKKGELISNEELMKDKESGIGYKDKLFLYFSYGKEDLLYNKKYSFYRKTDKWFECVEGLKKGMPDSQYSNFKFIIEVFK